MPNPIRTSIKDRETWPDDALRTLLARIDEEIERRSKPAEPEQAHAEDEGEEDLAALEQRLLWEARRYRSEGGVIRG